MTLIHKRLIIHLHLPPVHLHFLLIDLVRFEHLFRQEHVHVSFSSLLLLYYLIADVFSHRDQSSHLLSREGFCGDLESPSLELGGRHGQTLEQLIGQHDRLDVSQSLAIGRSLVVLPENLVRGVKGGKDLNHPLLVWHVCLVDPG